VAGLTDCHGTRDNNGVNNSIDFVHLEVRLKVDVWDRDYERKAMA
jgi:hypothetical protein